MNELGHVCELVRYPVKSMAGTVTESAFLGWYGLDGDRRFAFRRLGDGSGFPWLTASRVAELLLYHPFGLDESTGEPLPTHVRTPAGTHVELRSAELQSEVGERFGSSVELMKLKHGIFDEASVSVISLATIAGIGGEAGVDLDRRRFRANIVLETRDREPFLEDVAADQLLIAFIAPPWGDALSKNHGLDLRRTTPPIAEVVDFLLHAFAHNRLLCAVQVYETVAPGSLVEVKSRFDWSRLRVYDLNPLGENHGILLGTKGWTP